MATYRQVLMISKWVLEVIYILLALIALIILIWLFVKKDRSKSSKPKWLNLFIFAANATRAVLNAIPAHSYYLYIEPIPALQMCLDLLPELLYFSTYFLLLLIWIELYYFSRKLRTSKDLTRRLWIIFAGGNIVIYLAAALMAIIMGHQGPYTPHNLLAEAIFLSILSGSLGLAFPIYGYLLFKTLSRTNMSSQRKQRMLQKLQGLLISCLFCFVCHTVFILLLDLKLRFLRGPYTALIWSGYMFLTEQLPMALILFFTSVMAHGKSREKMIMKKPILREDPYNDKYYTPTYSDSNSTD